MKKLFQRRSADELTAKEIDNILGSYEERLKETEVIKEYRDSCPNYKKGKCAGAIFLESRSGCNFCLKKGTFDLNNAKPSVGTEEFEDYNSEVQELLKSISKKCTLCFEDSMYCRYKNIFNFCVFCNKEFRRER